MAAFLSGCQKFIGEALHEYRVSNQADLKYLLQFKVNINKINIIIKSIK